MLELKYKLCAKVVILSNIMSSTSRYLLFLKNTDLNKISPVRTVNFFGKFPTFLFFEVYGIV